MNLTALILTLRPLLLDPAKNWHRIVDLLSDHKELAEYEVARALVLRAIGPGLAERLRSLDPRERRAAVDVLPFVTTRRTGARHLRRLVKDPDLRVRTGARHAVRALGLDDTALPDQRARAQLLARWGAYGRSEAAQRALARGPGGWNPSGWNAGLRGSRMPASSPRPPRGDWVQRLPAFEDADALAAFLGYDDACDLTRFLRPGEGVGSGYVEFEIPKPTGGVRRIAAPRAELKAVQRKLLDTILSLVPVHDACHGFVTGRSTVTNARPHRGSAIVLKTDLADFFPTVHYRRVEGLFTWLGYVEEVAKLLAGLATHRPRLPDGRVVWPGVLPQGAPTSPAIANLVARRLDARLSALATKVGATYTRYADDLTFSFLGEPEKGLGRFFWWIDQITQQEGFFENTKKRRVFRPSKQQRVTGIVVNDELSIPRAERRRFRAMLANCRKLGVDSQARGRSDFRDYLRGFAAYVHMVQPALGAALLDEVRSLLGEAP
jgi:retron-type reverse transcriptase